MSKVELLDLHETRKLLEENQPILENRESAIKHEISEMMPNLEHAFVECTYHLSHAKKSAIDVVKSLGPGISEKAVPNESVRICLSPIRLESENPEYSITMTDVDVDFMAKEFRELLGSCTNVVAIKTQIKELLEELGEVRRKNNAIKHALIPQINERILEIKNKMEDDELDELVRLRFFKERLNQ